MAKHELTLTHNAAHILKECLPGLNLPGAGLWYKGQEHHSLPAIAILENLSDLHPPHIGEVLQKGDVARQAEVAADQEAWENESMSLEMSERERDACKACIEFYWAKQGALRLTRHLRTLILELGLAEE